MLTPSNITNVFLREVFLHYFRVRAERPPWHSILHIPRDNFSVGLAPPHENSSPSLDTFAYTDILVRYLILQHIARLMRNTPQK